MGNHIERLSEKVGLARTKVKRYLRKGESGKVEDVSGYVRKGLSVPEAHQLKIAKDTLKMPSAMQGVMGGPSPAKARETVQRLEARTKKPSTRFPTTAAEARAKKAASTPKTGAFLAHDANGNEIKTGSPVVVTGGPDKGLRGTVRGIAKGGGVRIEVAGNLGKTREVLVDPDELRVKSR